MKPILDVVKRAFVPAGIVLALTSGVAHADVVRPDFKSFMNHKSISEMPWGDSAKERGKPALSAMRPVQERGRGMNPFSRDSYLLVLIGPNFDDFARRNPYVVYASVLMLPDVLHSKAGRSILLTMGTPLPQTVPAPVPLPASLVLLLSGLGAVLGFRMRKNHHPKQSQSLAVTATA